MNYSKNDAKTIFKEIHCLEHIRAKDLPRIAFIIDKDKDNGVYTKFLPSYKEIAEHEDSKNYIAIDNETLNYYANDCSDWHEFAKDVLSVDLRTQKEKIWIRIKKEIKNNENFLDKYLKTKTWRNNYSIDHIIKLGLEEKLEIRKTIKDVIEFSEAINNYNQNPKWAKEVLQKIKYSYDDFRKDRINLLTVRETFKIILKHGNYKVFRNYLIDIKDLLDNGMYIPQLYYFIEETFKALINVYKVDKNEFLNIAKYLAQNDRISKEFMSFYDDCICKYLIKKEILLEVCSLGNNEDCRQIENIYKNLYKDINVERFILEISEQIRYQSSFCTTLFLTMPKERLQRIYDAFKEKIKNYSFIRDKRTVLQDFDEYYKYINSIRAKNDIIYAGNKKILVYLISIRDVLQGKKVSVLKNDEINFLKTNTEKLLEKLNSRLQKKDVAFYDKKNSDLKYIRELFSKAFNLLQTL